MRAGMCMMITLAALAAGWTAVPAAAQEGPSAEQMKKMYDDALQQLKASQERKNQLAAENEKLKQQIDAMTKELAAVKGEVQTLRQSDAGYAERTFFLRSHYMAWQAFARVNPETAIRWRLFLESGYLLSPESGAMLIDRQWPATIVEPATTQPATQPATTQPAATAPVATVPPATAPVATVPASTQPATVPAAADVKPATQPTSAPSAASQPATKP
ncbi:bZIP transcription factor [Humisphaera borealis]|uniref:OmpH family outer membrane protein n=1 Tax=Humisphaera borealis TaxID=2807512 RepID=A0A7M2WW99_9BACT|nr:bZIP transcription factor [Humisphaera borealis]QOV89594.1 hypothetical protein IPV69_25960 [Humisphaera borealis]